MVQKAPACTIETLAKAVIKIFNPNAKIKIIGLRHGEKMYEALLTKEEAAKSVDMGNFYRVPADNRDLNYDKYLVDGSMKITKTEQFDSNNTEILNVQQVMDKLLSLPYIQDELTERKS